MTLAEVRRLAPGDHAFCDRVLRRVARPPLVRRRDGYRVRLEAASGVGGRILEASPGELRPFGRLRRMSPANAALLAHLRAAMRRAR